MASSSTLPPLVETFPAEKYPLREVGQGFTAQACQGQEAEDCAQIAGDMLLESRTFEVSAAASVSSETSFDGAGTESFSVSDLTLPEDDPKVCSFLSLLLLWFTTFSLDSYTLAPSIPLVDDNSNSVHVKV